MSLHAGKKTEYANKISSDICSYIILIYIIV